MKYPVRGGFVGFNGTSYPLKAYPDDHPVVAAFPDLFTDTPPPGVKPEKPKRSRLTKKAAAKIVGEHGPETFTPKPPEVTR